MRKNTALKIAIIKSGHYQYDTARMAKVPYARLIRLLNGYVAPTPDEMTRLATTLGCEVQDIFPEANMKEDDE